MRNLKFVLTSILATSMLALAPAISASDDTKKAKGVSAIQVTWGDFNDYRDVRPAMEPKGPFHKRVRESFDKFFKEYGGELPDGQTLAIDIRDLDLAGHVLLARVNEIRIMKDIYFPRMTFTYKLTNSTGKVLKEGEAKIKDMNYLYHEKTWKRYSEGFYYEKRMFREWFEENILEK
ncbi:DUF3016 domain-containing protein [Kangiella shandongensis]|uniref:DUF3016 domain-containing protein n=1 Tax=Kangiella shandongensis TaxID=2763258 RepID=UPI001CBCC2F9|nr:DUF3016 domain-containing protein [Kangiella shandongensis]